MFTVDNEFTKETVLKELQEWQKKPGFMVITDERSFIIGHKWEGNFWIKQAVSDRFDSKRFFDFIKAYAKDRGLNSIMMETARSSRPFERYGFKKYTTIMRCEYD
jgi:hypothetical protein